MKVTVRAPATSANLGPGFDCLGLALDLWASVTVETVRGASERQQGPARLVRQGLEAAFEGGGRPPAVSVAWDAAIPVARGLGASAALRAAGLLAGNALLDNVHSPEALFEMGTKLEGHPDNMAPCLFGGFQISVRVAGDAHAAGFNPRSPSPGLIHLEAPLPTDLKVVVYVPDFEMPTQESRRRLPRQLSREDAVFNVGRAALLVAALAAGRYDLLDEATQDRIHQPARSQIFTGLIPIMAAAKEAAVAAAYLSGGGSAVAALVSPLPLGEGRGEGDPAERVARLMTQAAIAHGFSGRSIITRPTRQGAHIV